MAGNFPRKDTRLYSTVEELYKKAQPSYSNAGGFLVESEDDDEVSASHSKSNTTSSTWMSEPKTHEFDSDGQSCLECEKSFFDSYLWKHFDHPVCDECRDLDEKHALITRTDAKKEFILKDCDLLSREPPLRFISKKNPHNPRWGDMKLYLRLQVEKRAADVHGSIDIVEETKKGREEKRLQQRRKRFHKTILELRKTVRSDLYHKRTSEIHEHQYGDEEEYDSTTAKYFRQCTQCDHKDIYEKM